MIRRIVCVVLMILLASPAKAGDIVADLSSHKIEMSVGFNGTNLLIFGALEYPADIAVVIRGPDVRAKLWTKKRELGIWVNSNAAPFPRIPGYYAVATTRPLAEIASPATAARYDLSLDDMARTQNLKNKANRLDDYLALVQAQKERRLYQEYFGRVQTIEGKLFRTDFDLPDSVPMGVYRASIYLLNGGEVIAKKTVTFSVEQVGIESSVYRLAHYNPVIYAFLALVLSITLGGAGAYVFRRMS